ncbi:hypothetical protein PhaeoP24_01204 [Phaeobacter inhibens]|uniref:hypothetical protein n=2 Tax=Phaeobacter inhibens TaxID=221822 RepID=UPI000C9B2059|nr:hypothetical protein [Phaeobacter inhibens]AUQ89832.1 hypothetical protein PhaeoP24_01204 [Phaeobacter inhibens]
MEYTMDICSGSEEYLMDIQLASTEYPTLDLRVYHKDKYSAGKLQQKWQIRNVDLIREEWRDVPVVVGEGT